MRTAADPSPFHWRVEDVRSSSYGGPKEELASRFQIDASKREKEERERCPYWLVRR
jgi:hypothetical protein